MVVFPALSSPRTRIRASLSPKNDEKSLETKIPIPLPALIGYPLPAGGPLPLPRPFCFPPPLSAPLRPRTQKTHNFLHLKRANPLPLPLKNFPAAIRQCYEVKTMKKQLLAHPRSATHKEESTKQMRIAHAHVVSSSSSSLLASLASVLFYLSVSSFHARLYFLVRYNNHTYTYSLVEETIGRKSYEDEFHPRRQTLVPLFLLLHLNPLLFP